MHAPEVPGKAFYKGNSMRGVFVPGETLVLAETAFETLRAGDVVAILDREPCLVHRIVEIHAEYAVTMGDNNDRPDPVKLTPDRLFRLVSDAVSPDGSVRHVARGDAGMRQFRLRQRKRKLLRPAGWLVRPLKPLKGLRLPARAETRFRDGTIQWSCGRIPVAARRPDGRVVYLHWSKRLFFRVPAVSSGGVCTGEGKGSGETDMRYGIPVPLLPFLGACMFGDAATFYGGLDGPRRAALESQCGAFGMKVWLYRYLHDVLPDEKRTEYQMIYRRRQVQAITCARELERLCCLLRENGLRFVLIKGADLAYRVYQDAALRHYGDWDIWFHPDDCLRAQEVLIADGWTPRYRDRRDSALITTEYHYTPFVRGGYVLEPHFTLSNFNGIDPREIWECTEALPGSGGQRILPPELNLLMLARHAAGHSYFHVSVPKLLIDSAAVMRKGTVDFEKVRSMSRRWGLPYPGDLLAAFPEFFPPDAMAEFRADPAKTEKFRSIFEMRGALRVPDMVDLSVSRFDAGGRLAGSILDHIAKSSPTRMRLFYRLPRRGAWWQVARAYGHYFLTRSMKTLSYLIHRDPGLREYSRLVESMESDSGRT